MLKRITTGHCPPFRSVLGESNFPRITIYEKKNMAKDITSFTKEQYAQAKKQKKDLVHITVRHHITGVGISVSGPMDYEQARIYLSQMLGT